MRYVHRFSNRIGAADILAWERLLHPLWSALAERRAILRRLWRASLKTFWIPEMETDSERLLAKLIAFDTTS